LKSEKYIQNLKNYEKAVRQLSKALNEPESEYIRDASIQRFAFTYELLWKTLKAYLEDIHGVHTVSPRQVFKEAFSLDLIEKESIFLAMIEARNALVHTYNEDQAIRVYQQLQGFLNAFGHVLKNLKG
jgi:nucleotidyltransferase substrate binding protein (TIGR01987 family)